MFNPAGQAPARPKVPKCKGCGRPWISGHSCIQPNRTPTTPTHWHRHDQGTQLFVDRPNSEGQFVLKALWKCGHTTLECTRSVEVRDRLLNEAAEALCYRCDRVQGECDRA